ncbi:metallophosphoesterase family protein [Rhizobium leguminosarum]|uniref:metallophosphoesterase family protein n=1 Tax=Rhizobium leguminosarum TaxID=384 RepID=UPI003F9822E3
MDFDTFNVPAIALHSHGWDTTTQPVVESALDQRMSTQPVFRILHLSDLHAGMTGQDLLWSNVKAKLFDDLRALYEQIGPWDAVIFSGDMTQKGDEEEFIEVERRLIELWALFRELGFEPELIVVPGNHDVQRPSTDDPEALLLKMWFDVDQVRKGFFDDPPTRYRQAVESSLANYTKWMERIRAVLPVARAKTGMMPGDQLIELQKDNLRVGLLTVNSTWLQISGDDYYGRLAVELKQTHHLETDLESWSRSNDFNLLVSHHPTDWFHPTIVEQWNSEISPPGRFDLHLFGHMHAPFATSTAVSGSSTRHLFQAPSLFGIETLADGKSERIHGYSLISLESDTNTRRSRIWPRLWQKLPGGSRKFIPNNNHFTLADDRHLVLQFAERKRSAGSTAKATVDAAADEPFAAATGSDPEAVLRALAYHLPTSLAHQHVRRVEQTQFQDELGSRRAVWLISDWGLGTDEFVAAVFERTFAKVPRTYRIDASNYQDKDSFTSEISSGAKCSFAQFCDAMANEEATVLLLDDVPIGGETKAGTVSVEKDIESLVALLLDFAPHLRVILRGRIKPRDATIGVVSLGPLDEADLKVYVADHERGGSGLTDLDTVGILFRLTNGYPHRVDASLRELGVISLEELATSNDDYTQRETSTNIAPPALQRAVQELSDTTDRVARRSFGLLQALAVFPQGAEFARVKRFNGPSGFYPGDASELQERALIYATETPEVGEQRGRPAAKILVVPRPVRDYLRDTLPDETLDSLNFRAAAILFGPDWMSGSTKWPTDLDYSSSKCRNADIANASALITRLFRHHRDDPHSRESISLLSLAASFVEALNEGSHYSSTSNFCQDMLPLIGEEYSQEKKAQLLRHYARALRMLGVKEKATAISREVLGYPMDKSARQSVLLNLAFLLEEASNPEAVQFAKEIIKINRHNGPGYQAQAIILEALPQGPDRTRKLKNLEQTSRRNGYNVAADNIALTLADESEDQGEAETLLHGVLASAEREKEFYNSGRAILRLAEKKINAGETLSAADLTRLINCYQFLLSERVPWMLNKCHRILWLEFVARREWTNLLTLFRYSSVIWRLRGDEKMEAQYLEQLQSALQASGIKELPNNPLTQYFRARTTQTKALAAQPTIATPVLIGSDT